MLLITFVKLCMFDFVLEFWRWEAHSNGTHSLRMCLSIGCLELSKDCHSLLCYSTVAGYVKCLLFSRQVWSDSYSCVVVNSGKSALQRCCRNTVNILPASYVTEWSVTVTVVVKLIKLPWRSHIALWQRLLLTFGLFWQPSATLLGVDCQASFARFMHYFIAVLLCDAVLCTQLTVLKKFCVYTYLMVLFHWIVGTSCILYSNGVPL